MATSAIDYHSYLASREWALLKKAVHERAKGRCERCGRAEIAAVHHLSYARVGHEELEDLQALCKPCHDFLSGTLEVDPSAVGLDELKVWMIRYRQAVRRYPVGHLARAGAANQLIDAVRVACPDPDVRGRWLDQLLTSWDAN